MSAPPAPPPSYLIISGGTGANSIASAFGPDAAYVLPVSDDGGSSSEILRCFGGPSIGDIRSRLTRLIPLPSSPCTAEEEERVAIYELLAYRFPSDGGGGEKRVREIWSEIVEGRSSLWQGIGEDKKECIRAFLVQFQSLTLRRAHKRFSFRNFSLGNGFLTGARDLFGSLPSAIFLFKSVAAVPPSAAVIPVINTNQTVTIAAELVGGEVIVGQCAISHPTSPPAGAVRGSVGRGAGNETEVGDVGEWDVALGASTSMSASTSTAGARVGRTASTRLRTHFRRDSRTFDTAPSPGESPPLNGREWRSTAVSAGMGPARKWSEQAVALGEGEEDGWGGGSNIGYTKGEEEFPLPDKIERLFYINLYGQEIFPQPNPDFLSAIAHRRVLVYSCGSLWTSIVPCLALRGLAGAIATSPTLRARVVLLNAHNDRETPGYTAADYVRTLVAMLGHYDRPRRAERAERAERGEGSEAPRHGQGQGHQSALIPGQWEARRLVSHVVYLEGAEVDVEVDQTFFEEKGIRLIGVPREIYEAEVDEEVGWSPTRTRTKRALFTPEAVEWAMQRVLENLD